MSVDDGESSKKDFTVANSMATASSTSKIWLSELLRVIFLVGWAVSVSGWGESWVVSVVRVGLSVEEDIVDRGRESENTEQQGR